MPSVIIKAGTPPTAEPDELFVDPGVDFDFVSDVAFKIVFGDESGSPDKKEPDKKKWKSERDNGKNKIKMKAKDNNSGDKLRFPYTILIGDAALDPAIIIN